MHILPIMTKRESPIHGGLGYWVGSLASAMRKSLSRELGAFEITPTQWAILEMCYRGEANTVSGLARVIPIDTAAISRQVDKLKAKGLVHRRRLARDRRSVRVTLTESGRTLVPKLAPSVHANNAKFLKGITEEERSVLTTIIQKILNTAKPTVYPDEKLSNE